MYKYIYMNFIETFSTFTLFSFSHTGEHCRQDSAQKRALIETVNDELKRIAQIDHSRHRSFSSFIANSLSAIAAYCFFEKKPAIEVKFINEGQLAIF